MNDCVTKVKTSFSYVIVYNTTHNITQIWRVSHIINMTTLFAIKLVQRKQMSYHVELNVFSPWLKSIMNQLEEESL
jgi:hypothetical protein